MEERKEPGESEWDLHAVLHTCVYKVNIMYELIECSRSEREREKEKEREGYGRGIVVTKIETGIILSIRDRLAIRMRECVCVHMSQGSKC